MYFDMLNSEQVFWFEGKHATLIAADLMHFKTPSLPGLVAELCDGHHGDS